MVSYISRAPPTVMPTLFSKREEEKTTLEIEDLSKRTAPPLLAQLFKKWLSFTTTILPVTRNETDGPTKTIIQIIALVIDERRGGD